MKLVTNTVVVPPGKYFLGDPCYAVPDDLWDELLESNAYFEIPVGKAGGHDVLGFSTAYGDGTYEDQYGHAFPVDAGLIGLVPVALVNEKEIAEYTELPGIWVEFTTPTTCSSNNGVLTFGKYHINTD